MFNYSFYTYSSLFYSGYELPKPQNNTEKWIVGRATNQFQPDRFDGEYFSMRAVILSRHSLCSSIICPTDMLEICMF